MGESIPSQLSSYEGRQDYVRTMDLPAIETWENKYPENEYAVHLEIPEFTCICPKTGLPDFAIIHVEYIPARECIELKSFKEYIFAYRSIGIFHEHVVNRLMDDFVKACQPRWAKIRGVFNQRGGIQTTVEREYHLKRETPCG